MPRFYPSRPWRARLVTLAPWLLFTPACREAAPEAPLSVFAAASLVDVLKAVEERYETESGQLIELHFAGSGTLATQVERGAPADVVIFAGPAPMDRLERSGMLAPDTRCDLLANALVVAVAADRGSGIEKAQDLLELERLAIADPKLTPAGQYAQKALELYGLWSQLQTRIVLLDDVRQALAAVKTGAAGAAIVYRTDVLSGSGVRLVFELVHPGLDPVVYPVAALGGAKLETARAFIRFLASEPTRRLFEAHGFKPLGEACD